MLINGIIISMPELTVRLGFDITVNTYLALRRATSHARIKYNNKNASNGTVISIDNFLAAKGKGAKKFRKIIYEGSEIARPLVAKKVQNLVLISL